MLACLIRLDDGSEGKERKRKEKRNTHFPNCLLLYADSFAVQGLMMVSDGET